MRILVVEDEASLAKQLTSSIAEAGYAVDHAADGERADFLAQTEQYDAIVLDLGLPKIDGLTLLRKWRRPRADANPDEVHTITRYIRELQPGTASTERTAICSTRRGATTSTVPKRRARRPAHFVR